MVLNAFEWRPYKIISSHPRFTVQIVKKVTDLWGFLLAPEVCHSFFFPLCIYFGLFSSSNHFLKFGLDKF